jgi:putative transposase
MSNLQSAHYALNLDSRSAPFFCAGPLDHLLLKTPRGNLSRIMRHRDGVYTQRYNRRYDTDGSSFRGRYKSIIVIDASSYILQVSRYIHRNPIAMKTPLVEDLVDYPWSSYPV